MLHFVFETGTIYRVWLTILQRQILWELPGGTTTGGAGVGGLSTLFEQATIKLNPNSKSINSRNVFLFSLFITINLNSRKAYRFPAGE